MCGIIGFIGYSPASKILFEGLKRLEYRGYDSVGIGILHQGRIIVKKDVGKVEDVAKRYNFTSIQGNIGIGHTRWATHGKVNKLNAHPHLSFDGKIAVVHNGIIENYLKIKKFLEKEGIKFVSDTDTEVIPNLIAYWMSKGFEFKKAILKTLETIKGSYALLILNREKNEMVAARKDSPLVIGIGNNGFFAASDIPAFLKYTRKVVYLKDGDVVFLTPVSMKVFNIFTKKFEERKVYEVSYEENSIEKGSFEHYMMKEILEQVEILKKFEKSSFRSIKKAVEMIKNKNRLFFVGAGTSYHAGMAGKYMLSQIAGLFSETVLASEFEYFSSLLDKNDVVFAISQSGETADVLKAVKIAKKNGIRIISLVNVPGSSLTRLSDIVIPMNAGIEVGVAATKTYTSELINLAILSFMLVNRENEIKKEIRFVQNVLYNLTAETTRRIIKNLAIKLKNKEHIFLIGRGLEYVTAMEAALKIKEISYTHAEAFAGGELKHGTIALIEKNTPVIVFVSKKTKDSILSNAEEVKSRGAYVIGVSSEREDIFNFWIKTPENGILNPVVQIVPMQLLAYQLAVLKGYDPDKPRNLAKSVTVI